jgi:hypothetical protein
MRCLFCTEEHLMASILYSAHVSYPPFVLRTQLLTR